MQVYCVFNWDLFTIDPLSNHFSAILELEDALTVLKATLKSSSVLSAVREDEAAIAMHLIILEVSQVYSSIVLLSFFSIFVRFLSIFTFILFYFRLGQGQLAAPMLCTILELSWVHIAVFVLDLATAVEQAMFEFSRVLVSVRTSHYSNLHGTFFKHTCKFVSIEEH